MNPLNTAFIQAFMQMTEAGYQRQWHERNGGNLSYRMKDEDVQAVLDHLSTERPWSPIGTAVPTLAHAFFVVTGSGKYFKNVHQDPLNSLAIIELDAKGENYRIRYGLSDGTKPTSELPSHLMNHAVKKRQTHGAHRVIYHGHPVNVIALTYVLPLETAAFTKVLWQMATECPIVFPDGLGIVPWMVPGGRKIAVETSKLMEMYDAVVWAHHGLFCSGPDFDTTFGLFDVIEKAASTYVQFKSMNLDTRQTITRQNFIDLAKAFNVTLNEAILKEID